MTTIHFVNRQLCCSIGMWGLREQALMGFSAGVDWAKQNGSDTERLNLKQQSMTYAVAPLLSVESVGQRALRAISGISEATRQGEPA